MNPPSPDEFRKGYMAFQQHERRDAMYKTAAFLVNYFWDHPADIAIVLASSCSPGTRPFTGTGRSTSNASRKSLPPSNRSSTASGLGTSLLTLRPTMRRLSLSLPNSCLPFKSARALKKLRAARSPWRRRCISWHPASFRFGILKLQTRTAAITQPTRPGHICDSSSRSEAWREQWPTCTSRTPARPSLSSSTSTTMRALQKAGSNPPQLLPASATPLTLPSLEQQNNVCPP